jgi:hypothetical protein
MLAFISTLIARHVAENADIFKVAVIKFQRTRQFSRSKGIVAVCLWLARQYRMGQGSMQMRVPCVEVLGLHNKKPNTIKE